MGDWMRKVMGRVGLFEECEAFAEACGVFVGDGEDSDAALGAAGVADQVWAAAVVGVGYCVVYDLDERLQCHIHYLTDIRRDRLSV